MRTVLLRVARALDDRANPIVWPVAHRSAGCRRSRLPWGRADGLVWPLLAGLGAHVLLILFQPRFGREAVGAHAA